MSDYMSPEDARELVPYADHDEDYERALTIIANMRVEEDHRVVDPDTVGGRYETKRYERFVSEWREVPR